MKRKRICFIALIGLLLAICGSVVAYMYTQTEEKNNRLIPATVCCEVLEAISNNAKTGIQIHNNGNIDAYLRLRLTTHWENSSGQIIAKPSEMPTFSIASGWIAGANNTYYYSAPIAPDGSAPNLLASGSTIPLTVDEAGNKCVIEVFAEAIQSVPGSVVTDNWGVSVDSNGIITSAP